MRGEREKNAFKEGVAPVQGNAVSRKTNPVDRASFENNPEKGTLPTRRRKSRALIEGSPFTSRGETLASIKAPGEGRRRVIESL